MEKFIEIKGARIHNLKDIDVEIPRNKLTVVTGVSGSGKSSLVFDTLYAEGQRRYVESLSAYARQFLGKLDKPEVDHIKGLSPSIAIEQKVNTRNPRSTVATSTELYDYLKLLFARAGHTISPVSGDEVKCHTVEDVVEYIRSIYQKFPRIYLLAPMHDATLNALEAHMDLQIQKGFSRIFFDNNVVRIEELKGHVKKEQLHSIDMDLIVDRLVIDQLDEATQYRVADSVQTAFWEGQGELIVYAEDDKKNESRKAFSNKFELDGMAFERPSVNFLSFNNPYGACKTCEGFGNIIGIDPDLVIPDKSLSLYDGTVAPWRGESLKRYQKAFIAGMDSDEFPIHKPYFELSSSDKQLLWEGKDGVAGINDFFVFLEENSYKIQYRVMMAKYKGKTTCPECHGTRIRKEANYVKLLSETDLPDFMPDQRSVGISDVLRLPVSDARAMFNQLQLGEADLSIGKRLLAEITRRLEFLADVGLGYLSLNRRSNSLSGGESQRINLATSLGSSLVGSTYILDEPSIGLHPRDTQRLIRVLEKLRDAGNTVVVVEHDEEVMQSAQRIIDIGPLAGEGGGEVVFSGEYGELKNVETLTAKYLTGREAISVPTTRRKWNNYVGIEGARLNNLANVSVKIPLNCLTAVSGVSGSGKTSLVKGILYPAIQRKLGKFTGVKPGDHDDLTGDFATIQDVEMVDQNPIGKSSRSNPVTYIKAYDAIRDLFADLTLSKQRGYKSSVFSFNVDGGRCDNCKGEGEEIVEMQFMADLHLTCEVCKGKRFKEEVLEVKHKGASIFDVLSMTVSEAMEFFEDRKIIQRKLKPLMDVGLGYLSLGQSSSTLSGGEAQRIKLAHFLSKGGQSDHTLFIFDEPTTGLHFHDIRKLLDSFDALIERGNTIITIEHNPDVIKYADWVVDLGPEGGDKGGQVVFEGTPEDLANAEGSHTAPFVKERL